MAQWEISGRQNRNGLSLQKRTTASATVGDIATPIATNYLPLITMPLSMPQTLLG
jgi:hypothetical protein